MGQRVTQRILQCDECGKTPSNGEYLWEMPKNTHLCQSCADKEKTPYDLNGGDLEDELACS